MNLMRTYIGQFVHALSFAVKADSDIKSSDMAGSWIRPIRQ